MTKQTHTDLHGWQDCLADLAFTCAAATPSQGAELLRIAHALLISAPGPWQRHFSGLPSVQALETLISVGGEASATLALLERRCGYLLSHGADGSHMATVVIEGQGEEASASGDSAAIALIGALAACLAGPASEIERGHFAGMTNVSMRIN